MLLAALLSIIGAPLGHVQTVAGGKCDIVSFEIAGTVERASAIAGAWNAHGLLYRARWNTWLDYLFLLCYPNLVAMGITGLLGGPMTPGWRLAGRVLAWMQWVVLASDAVENAAILRMLYGTVAWPLPQAAFSAAIVKFGLLLAGILFLGITFFRQRRVSRAR